MRLIIFVTALPATLWSSYWLIMSKNYLNHLFNTNEILASMLLTLHNINFYQELMASIRKNINEGTFDQFHDKYIDKL